MSFPALASSALFLVATWGAVAIAPVPNLPGVGEPGPVMPNFNSDYIDFLDSDQLLRNDESGRIEGDLAVVNLHAQDTITATTIRAADHIGALNTLSAGTTISTGGDIVAGNRVSAGSLCLAAKCRASWDGLGGPFDLLRESRGRSFQFAVTSTQGMNFGYFGGTAAPEPRIYLGDLGQPGYGFIPSGTVISYGFRFLLQSGSGSGSSVLFNSVVNLHQHGLQDPQFPGALRVQFTRNSDAAFVTEPWTTYVAGASYIEMVVRVWGAAPGGARVTDVTLSIDGGSAKTFSDVRYSSATPVLQALTPGYPPSPAPHQLLSAAGEITYP